MARGREPRPGRLTLTLRSCSRVAEAMGEDARSAELGGPQGGPLRSLPARGARARVHTGGDASACALDSRNEPRAARARKLLLSRRRSRNPYGADSSGHTSTTPCAIAHGVLETRLTASSRVGASMTANPAIGRSDRRNGPTAVSMPAPS
jgi:hypothetical protein